MFIYETRNIYASDHSGPFHGIIVSSTDGIPAQVGDTVVFCAELFDSDLNTSQIDLTQEFTIGTKE